MNILDEVKRDATALVLVNDWLGEGGTPVLLHRAEERASICVQCRNNVEPGWWDRFKMAVADTIRAQIEIKNRSRIRVSCEEQLAMCGVCGCCNRLKVHVPIKHIVEHTPEPTMQKFPPWCWIKHETES